jgi:hypothetical protein
MPKEQITQLIHGQMNPTDSSQRQYKLPNKYMRKCSTSLAVKEMQIKMTLRFYFTLAIIKKTDNKCCKDEGLADGGDGGMVWG